jgi:hypothetical protein
MNIHESIDICNFTGSSYKRCGREPIRYFLWGDIYGPSSIIARCEKHLPGPEGTGEYILHFKIIPKEDAIILDVLNS